LASWSCSCQKDLLSASFSLHERNSSKLPRSEEIGVVHWLGMLKRVLVAVKVMMIRVWVFSVSHVRLEVVQHGFFGLVEMRLSVVHLRSMCLSWQELF